MKPNIAGFSVVLILSMLRAALSIDAHGPAQRVGVLGPAEEPRFSEVVGGLQQGLREQGYREQTVEILEGRVTRGDRSGVRLAVEGFIQSAPLSSSSSARS